jgi:hypothetical protein
MTREDIAKLLFSEGNMEVDGERQTSGEFGEAEEGTKSTLSAGVEVGLLDANDMLWGS